MVDKAQPQGSSSRPSGPTGPVPTPGLPSVPPRDVRKVGLLKDWPHPTRQAPWAPRFSTAVRLLLFVRIVGVIYNGIADCDETYNYWEPLHLLSFPPSPLGNAVSPFKTWEYVPRFAIRSWAYLFQYLPMASWLPKLLGWQRKDAFRAVRMTLAIVSTLCEASLYTAVAEVVNPRVARYMLMLLLGSAGLFHASTALIPSSFTMYTTTLALSFAFYPSRSSARFALDIVGLPLSPDSRALKATATFALGALAGWPFALVLSFPFVFEELLLPSGLILTTPLSHFRLSRLVNWLFIVFLSSLMILPLLVVDTLAYGRTVLGTLNIIIYNVLSKRRGAGPELYGTEPWFYYLVNLTLNFGPGIWLALASLPALGVTLLVDPKRVATSLATQDAVAALKAKKSSGVKPARSCPASLLALRLAPLYLWLGLLSLQPHKEERFIFPAYPLICFNAAVTLYLVRGWFETAYIGVTKSKYKASQTWLFTVLTSSALIATTAICLARTLLLVTAYRAPFSVLSYFSDVEVPGLDLSSSAVATSNLSSAKAGQSSEPLRLCYGKEWYRFPTTFLVPDGVQVSFIRSEFNGILPGHWTWDEVEAAQSGAGAWIWRGFTASGQGKWNDLNREEPDRYVDVDSCDYLIDLDFPLRFVSSSQAPPALEPRYAVDATKWDRAFCAPFLDTERSGSRHEDFASLGTLRKVRAEAGRLVWLPGPGDLNAFGDYCLLRRRRGV